MGAARNVWVWGSSRLRGLSSDLAASARGRERPASMHRKTQVPKAPGTAFEGMVCHWVPGKGRGAGPGCRSLLSEVESIATHARPSRGP